MFKPLIWLQSREKAAVAMKQTNAKMCRVLDHLPVPDISKICMNIIYFFYAWDWFLGGAFKDLFKPARAKHSMTLVEINMRQMQGNRVFGRYYSSQEYILSQR
jgi:hypothetical protein